MRRFIWIPLGIVGLLAAACSSGATASDEPAPPPEALGGVEVEAAATVAASQPDGGAASRDASGPEPKPAPSFSAGQRAITASVTGATAAEPYQFAFAISIDPFPDLPTGLTLEGSGAVDSSNAVSALRIDLSSLTAVITAQEGMSADDIAQVSALLGTEPIEFLVADGAAYIRWPFLGQSLGVATDWLMLPAEAIETAGAEVGASTDQLFEPTAFLTLFQEMADVAEVGREKVRGVETTHYRGVLDLRTVAQAYGLEEQIGAPATLGIAEDDLTALLLVPVDLWIDDADRLRRIEMRWDLGPVADVSEAAGITFSFELYAFGEPVTIALPAPDEVTDISDILLSSLSEVGDAVAFDGAAAGGGVYGSDPDLDALWDACAAGDLSACDRLYFESPVGSEYERFGDTCGEQREPGGLCAGAVGGGVYGSDPGLDALWDSCAGADFGACDRLYFESPVGSEYERFGGTCGERRKQGGLCAPAA